MYLPYLSPDTLTFPDPRSALSEPNGLLAAGGDLSAERLLCAYQQGIFPWFSPGEPILWWSPDPRAILPVQECHQSRSLRRFMRHSPFRYTLNQAFERVIRACGEQRSEGTWIGEDVRQGYLHLHQLGHAHSIEVWSGDQLVGGLYGVSLGKLFCGESMFSRQTNASKCALMVFCQHFSYYGGELIDCQVLNHHTASLGAREVPREHFLHALSSLSTQNLLAECWQPQSLHAEDTPLPLANN
jgi:leucyl/phenylalanyl-tRNA--protein transferase